MSLGQAYQNTPNGVKPWINAWLVGGSLVGLGALLAPISVVDVVTTALDNVPASSYPHGFETKGVGKTTKTALGVQGGLASSLTNLAVQAMNNPTVQQAFSNTALGLATPPPPPGFTGVASAGVILPDSSWIWRSTRKGNKPYKPYRMMSQQEKAAYWQGRRVQRVKDRKYMRGRLARSYHNGERDGAFRTADTRAGYAYQRKTY